ncbi:integrase [Rhodococcus ruber Chol-4]|uniref:tyrosine-type recombinase/integrase n=1 Tax=Rhodococcus ruber TaxID=1830 RepID=UPI00034A9A86|nr:site-specific integrase [Rhodococcus ruber]KXF88352.1 integrase [Rhodococcus ruber Chol-4]
MAKRKKRGFGGLRKLPSGRWQANYTAPDGLIYKAPRTFAAEDDAIGWLNAERRLIDMDLWTSPAERAKVDEKRPDVLTLGAYAERWYAETEKRHKPRTRVLNRGYLDRVILPDLGDAPIDKLTVAAIRTWFAGLDDFPARNSNAYSLLRTILNQAVDDEVIPSNPCRVKKAAVKHRTVEPVALSAAEVRALAAAMPDRYRALVLLAGFSGLRWGELVALRRADLVLTDAECSVTVARAVVRIKGQHVVGRPKSRAALRTVPLPSAIRPALLEHLDKFGGAGRSGLVFPAQHVEYLSQGTVRYLLKRASTEIGHPELRFHDLRHTAATLFAQAGATLADHMTLMGHTSSAMSARYTHSTAARTRALAESLWAAEIDQPS